jgi:hypothetical protein
MAAREGIERARLFGTAFPLFCSVAVDPSHEGLKYGSLISSPRNVPLTGLGSTHNFRIGLKTLDPTDHIGLRDAAPLEQRKPDPIALVPGDGGLLPLSAKRGPIARGSEVLAPQDFSRVFAH